MKNIVVALLLAVSHGVFSQNVEKVVGTIASSTNEKLAGATVLIIGEKTAETIKATFSDENGNFEFENLKVSTFRIAVQYYGFDNFTSEIYSGSTKELAIPTITLKQNIASLNEVTVIVQKPFVVQKPDKIVVNPDALISSAGLTALEILQKSPSVSVDFNNNISIRGKNGVLVLINDKPTYLAADELANYLKSIPASDVDFFEIMNNPPAKYDAAGNAGIINIKLKKNIAKGFNGGMNLSYGQGRFGRTNNSMNFNYRIQKWNFFSNLSIAKNNSYQDLTITRTYFTPSSELSSIFTQNSYITPKTNSNSLKFGADFYATKNTTFGIVLNGFVNPSDRITKNTATIQDENQQVKNLIQSKNPMEVDFKNSSVNLNMTHKIDEKGKEVSFNLDNIDYQSRIVQTLLNETFLPNGDLSNSSVLQSKLPSDINIKSAKIDYSGLKIKRVHLEIGAKSSYVKTSNVANFNDIVNGNEIPNYQFSNDFTYKENINAVYSNFSTEYRKISIEAGIRIENTNLKGYQAGNPIVADSTFAVKYTSLFPTLFVQYTADTLQNNVIGFSAGRRIDRPNYKDLNPFTYPIDRFTFYGGNPYIQPTFSYNFDVSHTFKKFLTTTLLYSYTTNVISETNEQVGNIYYSRPGNFAKQISYGVSVNGTFKIRKWWTLQLYTSYLNNKFESRVYTENLDDSKWYFVAVPTNLFTVSKKWSAELSGQYQSEVLSGQFLIAPIGSVKLGFSKKILKDKGSLKLNVSDIFYTNQVQGEIRNIANANANWFSYLDSRVATLSFSYRFSKGDNLQVRQSGASDTEKQRVKT